MPIKGSLLDRVQKAMTLVPESFVGMDFRSSILFSIQMLMTNPHLRHVHTQTKDTVWRSWMMHNLSHISDMAYKNLSYVDLEAHGPSLFEQEHYHKKLGGRCGSTRRVTTRLRLRRTKFRGICSSSRCFARPTSQDNPSWAYFFSLLCNMTSVRSQKMSGLIACRTSAAAIQV
jgi:hypothetical protein